MAYCTAADVREALAPGGSQDATLGTAASLVDGDLTDAITEAETQLNAALASRYTVPLAPVPDGAKFLTRDIAAYLATLTYRRGNPLTPDDPVRLRYTRAQAMLDALSKGQASLVGVAAPVGARAEADVENLYDGVLFDADTFGIGPAGPFADPLNPLES